MDTPDLLDSVHIAASPERVWSLVSDVRRMSEWSPQVESTRLRSGFAQQALLQTNGRVRALDRLRPCAPTTTADAAFGPMREGSTQLDDEPESGWSPARHTLERAHARQTIVGRIDLDGREHARIAGEHVLIARTFRIERTDPVTKAVAGCPHEDHFRTWPSA